MEIFKELIQSVVSFLIVEAFLLTLVSDKGFQKLIKTFCGILLILILLRPVCELFGMSADVSKAAGKLEMDKMYEAYAKEIEEGNIKLAEYYYAEYEGVVKEQVQAIVEAEGLHLQQCEITTDGDETCRIARIKLVLARQEGSTQTIPMVKPVVVGAVEKAESEERVINENPQYVRIRNEMIGMYGLEKEQIEIVEVE